MVKRNIILLFAFIAFISAEKESEENIVFPSNCYYHYNKGGYVLDITKAPFNADNAGNEDCTEALIQAYDFTAKIIKKDPFSIKGSKNIIYLPNGTYKISRTIIYSGKTFFREGDHEGISRIRFLGQNKNKTKIQLVDNAPGFEKGKAKPVISFGKHYQSNQVSSNFFENITINTGKGNPGAIGLRFHGANNQAVRNVNIISGDGTGHIGLDMPMGACQGMYKNIFIEGFDYGVHVSKDLAKSLTFEHITIKNQNIAGFHLEESSVSIRKLTSFNTKPSLILTNRMGHAVIIDSELHGLTSDTSAIIINKGVLFARNVKTEGYKTAVKKGEKVAIEGNFIEEYVSEKKITLFNKQEHSSLNLPIEETPEFNWESDISKWACINDFGAIGDGKTDNTMAIQKAMNSGKPVIYFLPGSYLIDSTINIPASVKRVNLMFSRIVSGPNIKDEFDMPMFHVKEYSEQPILFEDMFNWFDSDGVYCIIGHSCTRTVVLQDFHSQRGRMYKNFVEGGKVFIENASNRTSREGSTEHIAYSFTGQQVWMRYCNPEYSIPQFFIDNSKVWILGFKTEGPATSFEVVNGGELEILGGIVNAWGRYNNPYPQVPVLINNNSSVTAVFTTNGPRSAQDNSYFKVLIEEIHGNETAQILCSDTYRRVSNHGTVAFYYGINKNK